MHDSLDIRVRVVYVYVHVCVCVCLLVLCSSSLAAAVASVALKNYIKSHSKCPVLSFNVINLILLESMSQLLLLLMLLWRCRVSSFLFFSHGKWHFHVNFLVNDLHPSYWISIKTKEWRMNNKNKDQRCIDGERQRIRAQVKVVIIMSWEHGGIVSINQAQSVANTI